MIVNIVWCVGRYLIGSHFEFPPSSRVTKFIEAFKGKNCKRKIISRFDNKLKIKIGNTELTQGFANLVGTTVEYF